MAWEDCTPELDAALKAQEQAGRMPKDAGIQPWNKVNALASIAVAAEIAALRQFLTQNTVVTERR